MRYPDGGGLTAAERAGAEHKRRIKDLARQLLPLSPLTGDPGAADLAVLERYADPAPWPGPAWTS